MCGIAGFFQKGSIDHRGNIRRMMDIQKHRGPDDNGICGIDKGRTGFFITDNKEGDYGSIGFNRLSIQDVSDLGHQPMISKDGDVVIAFNGEIYNKNEIKNRYLKDIRLKGDSDTEVILELYVREGIRKTALILNGMFAICIADMRSGHCYVIRDRMGIKPVYIFNDDNNFVFASEVKSILSSGLVEAKLNANAVQEVIRFGFLYRRTLIQNVNELTPGNILDFDLNTFTFKEDAFWSVVNPKKKKEENKETASIIEEAVERQLISDVPVGTQLSGGIDSSLITYFLSKHVATSVNIKRKSIGIIIDNEDLSEEKWMDQVAGLTGMELQKELLTSDWMVDNWEKAVWFLDGIPGFGNELGIMLLAKKAKEKYLTVLLSGEGADELFAGYFNLSWGGLLKKIYSLSNSIPIIGNKLHNKIELRFPWAENNSEELNIEDSYLIYNGGALHRKICSELFVSPAGEDEIILERMRCVKNLQNEFKGFDRIRAYEIMVRLPALLNRQDKMTMSFSVENRVPFLDNKIIDYALTLREKDLVRLCMCRYSDGGIAEIINGKYPLKKVSEKLFGKEFTYRKKKGFSIDYKEYIKAYLSKNMESILESIGLRGIFNTNKVKKLFNHIDEYPNNSEEVAFVWRIISLEMFCKQFIDRKWM